MDRVTCCFVLLAISMLVNILYYGIDTTNSNQQGIKMGSLIYITWTQIGIGFLSNIFVFLPSFILVQMFRSIKHRHSRISRIKEILNQDKRKTNVNSVIKVTQNKIQIKLPWWCKFVAYFISLLIAGSCLIVVTIKGIEFGDEKAAKWLTSLLFSFFCSILFTQPIQVNIDVFRTHKL
jgi:hypothetical protein